MSSHRDALADKLAVLVVDDHALVRSGLRRLLEDIDRIGSVAEASSGEECLEMTAQATFDLVLMDISLTGMSGLEAAKRLIARNTNTRIIMVSGTEDLAPVRSLLEYGVNAYVTKGSSSAEIEQAIRAVIAGKQYLSADIAERLAADSVRDEQPEDPFTRLTTREIEVVQLLLSGHRNSHISNALHISEKTVSTHRVRAFEKLDISNTAALVRLAIRYDRWSED